MQLTRTKQFNVCLLNVARALCKKHVVAAQLELHPEQDGSRIRELLLKWYVPYHNSACHIFKLSRTAGPTISVLLDTPYDTAVGYTLRMCVVCGWGHYVRISKYITHIHSTLCQKGCTWCVISTCKKIDRFTRSHTFGHE